MASDILGHYNARVNDEVNQHNDLSRVSKVFELERSRKFFKRLQYSYLWTLPSAYILFGMLLPFVLRYTLWNVDVHPNAWWTPDCTLTVLLFLPSWMASLPPLGFLIYGMLPLRPFELSKTPKCREFRHLRICLVTRGQNHETVLGSIQNWTKLKTIDSRLCFHIALDGQIPEQLRMGIPDCANVVVVPPDYKPRRAMYKARALEYFRIKMNLQNDDWVLHLDEETRIDAYAVNRCLDFIERSHEHIGMGTILYNATGYWDSVLMTAIEMTRVTADFARFRLPVYLFKKPLNGWIHGSFIVINGEVENRVTWDTANEAEDFWFGLNAKNLGYGFAWINGIAREQPPTTFMDFCRQRRRWYSGIWKTGELLPRASYFSTIWGLIGFPYFLWIVFIRDKLSVYPYWVFVWGVITGVDFIMSTSTATILSDLDAGVPFSSMLAHILYTLILIPMITAFEALLMAYAILLPSEGFHVVRKI